MKQTLLRHSVSGVTTAFPEDYAESLLADPVLGQYLEVVEEEIPCFDCPPQEPVEEKPAAKTKAKDND